MKVSLSCSLQSFSDKRQAVICDLRRSSKEGPVIEVVMLRFAHQDSYKSFKNQHRTGDSVQVFGLLRQMQSFVVDPASRKPVKRSDGSEILEAGLAVEVREHRPIPRPEDTDHFWAFGIVGVVDKRDGLRVSAAGTSYLRMRVAYNHYKRANETEGQADFYDLIAFGGQAESLLNLEKGDRFLVDYALPASHTYAMRDLTFADGTPIKKSGLELRVREFTFLPRSRTESRTRRSDPLPLAL
ncbi:MAG: single-stranded DNA-binding protein [Candidatus Sericytochromatia bacterium]|nr:single-stranded DNA-binding protein [Candidatus Sericytochromatia bacterium]